MSETIQGRFKILHHSRDDDSYFYSDTDDTWYITSIDTGDELLSFSGHCYQGRSGTSEGGVSGVSFDDNGEAIVATSYDGSVERVELPEKVEIIDGGKAILLSYRGGRTETRPRSRVVTIGKYGNSTRYSLVSDPDAPPAPPAPPPRAAARPRAAAKPRTRKKKT